MELSLMQCLLDELQLCLGESSDVEGKAILSRLRRNVLALRRAQTLGRKFSPSLANADADRDVFEHVSGQFESREEMPWKS